MSHVWKLWLAVFVLMEAYAYLSRRRTLSQSIWAWCDKPWERAMLGLFLAWLFLHLVFRV